MTFGPNLRRLMKERRITQKQVGERFGLTPQAVGQWLSGKTMPLAKRMAELAELLGVSVDELTGAAPEGFRESGPAFTGPAPRRLSNEEFVTLQEAVAERLSRHGLPNRQADIASTVRLTEDELALWPTILPFDDRLEKALDAVFIKLLRSWTANFVRS